MKITKRQLKRIIKEEKAKLMEYGGRPYDPTVPSEQSKQLSAGMKTTVDDYITWAEENGHITPAASSVVASPPGKDTQSHKKRPQCRQWSNSRSTRSSW